MLSCSINSLPGPTERPHLSEAGPAVFDILIKLRQRVSAIVCMDVAPMPLVTVDVYDLVKQILLMLIGIPSKLFPFSQESQSFTIVDGLHVSGISPEMLTTFLSEFTETGTCFTRLTQFSQPPILNSFYTGGLVFQAFAGAIRKFLSHFTAAILRIPKNLQLVNLKVYLLKAMEQIRYISKLCHCHDRIPSSALPEGFPTGMKLLSYLYKEAEVSSNSNHYPLLLSILQTTYAPFILFIRDWVFHGVFRDNYDEFMIKIDLSCVESRDETYWSRAYTLMSEENNGEGIPHFLADSISELVTCGKSINLLRICNPQHFMCNVSESDIPPLSITFSYGDLKVAEKYCQTYARRMQQMSSQNSVDRQEVLRKIELQVLELQQMARQMAESEIARLQQIIDQRKRDSDTKKRKEFERLKKQMETDLKRKSEESRTDKELDRQFMARLNREQNALTEKEIQLEKKARDELIAYYTELGEEAMHREQLALWKVKRAQLEHARLLFLEADAERWRNELSQHLKHSSSSAAPHSTLQELPRWATRSSTEVTPIIVTGEEEITPPSWAQDLLPPNININADPFENGLLPKWAQKENQLSTDTQIIEIADEEENFENSNESESVTEAAKDDKDRHHPNVNPTDCAALFKANFELANNAQGKTQEIQTQSQRHRSQIRNISEESKEHQPTKSTIKFVDGASATGESDETIKVRYIKTSAMSASKESDHDAGQHKPHAKIVDGFQVNAQSSEERQMIPKRQKRDPKLQTATSETQPEVWVIRKPSIFGHVSQISNAEYILTVPKLRRQSLQYANMESDFKSFAIRPQIRISKSMSATKESETQSAQQEHQKHIRMSAHHSASSESNWIDWNAQAVQRFRARNVWGHSSDSTIQQLLYGNSSPKDVEKDVPLERIEFHPMLPYKIEPYRTNLSELAADEPQLDLMSHIFVADLGRDLVDAAATSEEKVEAYKYTPLSVLLTRSITAPIKSQISLVNNAVINYFTTELKVDSHFQAVRRYLLMADGDFAEILANILLEKMSTNPLPQEVLNPVFLNGTLNKAIRSSIHSDDENTHNLNFVIKYMPSVFMSNAPNSLNCLELKYNVAWPLNIILTSACMEKYHKVFNFLLQIKRVVWTLKDVWHKLKRDTLINRAGSAMQFRHLQLHRQEMEHFVKMMQGYITNQVIHVSWQEFQTALSQPIAGLDQLHTLHQRYIDKVISRCLLDKKAEKVMKIIQDIFCLILKFRSQLVSCSWQRVDPQSDVTHPNFTKMVSTYKSFHVYSFFLFKVVNRLSQKGYQPHLQELLLQLNFNDYYTEAAS